MWWEDIYSLVYLGMVNCCLDRFEAYRKYVLGFINLWFD